MKRRQFTTAAAGGLVAASSLGLYARPARANYFEGRTIDLYISSAAGGGTDTAARLFAQNLSRFIPGNPDIIPRNLEGAGGNRARNFVYEQGRPDGTQLLYTTTALQDQILGAPGIAFDHRDLTIIGPLRDPPIVAYARRDLEPGGLENRAAIASVPHLKLGGTRPSAAIDMMTRASLDLMGVEYTYVSGYAGGSVIHTAVRSGEVDMGATSAASYHALLKTAMADVVQSLWYYPVLDADGNAQRSANLGDELPTFVDVFREATGTEPSGPNWEILRFVLDIRSAITALIMGPPGMEPEAQAILRDAFTQLMADAEFQALQEQALGYIFESPSFPEAERAYQDLDRFDPAVIDLVKAHVEEGEAFN